MQSVYKKSMSRNPVSGGVRSRLASGALKKRAKENCQMAKATLLAGQSRLVTTRELAKIPTPEPTDTWTPVPHHIVPEVITDLVKEREWGFVDNKNPFQISVTPDNLKMFGVTKVAIPGVQMDAEMQMAIGFRNSHNRTMALRIAVGTSVMVCDNLMITGDLQVRREHTRFIDPRMVLEQAFDRIPEASKRLMEWMVNMRGVNMGAEGGVSFLAEAVEAGALPIGDFMDARRELFLSLEGNNEQIGHRGTLWAAYQTITAQWRDHSLNRTQGYSENLNKLVFSRYPKLAKIAEGA